MTSITTLPQLKATYENARRAMILGQMKQGRTMREAAEALGVSTSSIQNYCHQNGIKWRGRKRPKVAFCGSENPNAKLTEADVRAIRSSGERPTRMARNYGVSVKTIEAVRAGTTWGWLQ